MDCLERTELSHAVAEAVRRSHTSKAAFDRVKKSRGDSSSAANSLEFAQTAELSATKALTDHRDEHGC